MSSRSRRGSGVWLEVIFFRTLSVLMMAILWESERLVKEGPTTEQRFAGADRA